MAMKNILNILAFFFLLSVAGCKNGDRPDSGQQEVVFGAILPMTGAAAQYGDEARQGIEIALEYLRESQDTSRYAFTYELQDSETNPRTAETALRTLRARHNVFAFVSEVSGVVLALAPICEREQIVQINVGAQNPNIADAGAYTFSMINLANIESRQIAEYAYDVLGARRVAVLYAAASYGQGARDVFVNRFIELGGEIAAESSYPVEGTDYRAQIREISQADPEVVYLPGTTQDMARVLRQSFEVGFRPQWLSYTAFEGEEILSLSGQAAEGVVFASAYLNWDNATGLQAEFRDRYREQHLKLPSVYAATSFDAILLLANAMLATELDALALREYLQTMVPFQGTSGVTKFEDNGTVNKPLTFKTVRGGQFVAAEQQHEVVVQ